MVKLNNHFKCEDISKIVSEAEETIKDVELRGKNLFEGINVGDYHNLFIVKKILEDSLCDSLVYGFSVDEDFYKVYNKINYLVNYLNRLGFFQKYSPQTVKYILENTNILPLVLANDIKNSVRDINDFNYYFDCQFNNEHIDSMFVNNIKNYIYCGECGERIDNQIIYLQKIEKISYAEAVALLDKVYMIGVENSRKVNSELVKKYRSALLSEDYIGLLRNTKDKLECDEVQDINGLDIENYFQKIKHNIKRVRHKTVDSNYESPIHTERVFLKSDYKFER